VTSATSGTRRKVVLYNPQAVFFTMPLALLAIGSELEPDLYEVVIVDARLDADAPCVSGSPCSPARLSTMRCKFHARRSGHGHR